MGKKLVIKGADFSENGIQSNDSVLSLFSLTLGQAWGAYEKMSPEPASSNVARASDVEYVPIDGSAYGTISLQAKAGYKFACYFGTTDSYGVQNANLVNWEYTTSGETLVLDISTALYALIMVASNDNSELTSTNIRDYILDV